MKKYSKTCNLEKCNRKYYARGWCSMHYKRWLAHGDPHILKKKVKNLRTFHCKGCNKEIKDWQIRKFCSHRCSFSNKYNPKWNGGKKTHWSGYIMVRKPSHPNATQSGYIREHRLVMEQCLGRLLREDELVHHKNGNIKDNRIENLEITNRSDHKKIHHPDIGMSTRFVSA